MQPFQDQTPAPITHVYHYKLHVIWANPCSSQAHAACTTRRVLVFTLSGSTTGTMYVAVNQQQISPTGWPILLQPAACSCLAFTGQGPDPAALQTIAGELLSVLVETRDALGQRICQVQLHAYSFSLSHLKNLPACTQRLWLLLTLDAADVTCDARSTELSGHCRTCFVCSVTFKRVKLTSFERMHRRYIYHGSNTLCC